MNRWTVVLAGSILGTAACGIRGSADSPVIPPNSILDFSSLYAQNCAGCHGSDGKGGAAMALSDPVYLAIADDAAIRTVTADGVTGTAMPAFAQSSGGSLTDQQIGVLVAGIRARWAKPDVLHGANPPPYTAQTAGDPSRGAKVYEIYCSSCHGVGGKGGERASSIVDKSYLTLVSNQSLRTTVIAGRPEMGAPDWRGNLPGKPMSPDDVSDVVAWLAAERLEGGIR